MYLAHNRTVMKTVVTNPYHLWANEVQAFARNGSGNRSFRDSQALSYSTVIAIIAKNPKGTGRAFLISTRSYSVTTSKHYSEIRHAIPPGERIFNVAYLSTNAADVKSQVQDYLVRIQEAALKAKRARTSKEYRERDVADLISELRAYVTFFNVKGVRIPGEDTVAAMGEVLEKIRKAEREAERKAALQARKDAQKSIDKWLAGENVQIPYSVTEAFLRVQGSDVVTSRGAEVPLEHVQKAMPLVLRLMRSGGTYSRLHSGAEIRLGYYRVDSLDAQGNLRVGCHYFTKMEIERFATVLATMPVPTE